MQKEGEDVYPLQVEKMLKNCKRGLGLVRYFADRRPHGLEIFQALLRRKYERQTGSFLALNSRDNGTLTQWYLAHPIHLNSFLPKT